MTAIQWTDRVWNPVSGCTKVSKGCQHCYAERQADRKLPKGGFTDRPFTEVRCHPNRLDIPMHWKKPQRVFVNSMSDLFHEDVPDEFIDQVFAVMALCPQQTFQVLTKRPERMRQYLSHTTGPDNVLTRVVHAAQGIEMARGQHKPDGPGWPYRNVWLGVSVEDQATADERIPQLLETPAALRWVSYEPALGPVDFTGSHWWDHRYQWWPKLFNKPLDWIVVGGESGPGARTFDVAWARSTVEQCKAAGVPVFVKQLGAQPRGWCALLSDKYIDGQTPDADAGYCDYYEAHEQGAPCSSFDRKCHALMDRKGGDPSEWPTDLRVREWPEVRS